ncbi:MAG: hypothetical protein E6H00_13045 [Bacillati bacterium ANGP1]|uniref:Uncharacterized protein n=1 Tax=Candidatus Segetimicrobium genomatis TaxID=2569760 RepID=A0A537JXX2_9BACT|nr:MAG: hypothetical protein E6H00_13045 [Terrabacteria group bacterium ANGP1]
MNYYTRTQQALALHAAQSAARLAYFEGIRGMGQELPIESPKGTRLRYRITYKAVPLGSFGGGLSAQDLITQVSTALSSMGDVRVIDSAADQPGLPQHTVYLTVLDLLGHQYLDDVRRIIDGVFLNMGRQPLNSDIAVAAAVQGGTVPPGDGSGNLGQWIADNWGWLALGGGLFLLLSEAL